MPSADSLVEQLLRRVPESPDIHLQQLDLVRRAALLVALGADGYRQASFLDDRILRPETQGAWVPVDALAASAGRIPEGLPVHFIAHSGHVGSTLVSRLLDATDSVLSLREPLALRTLADAHDVLGRPDALWADREFEGWVALCLRLWGRGYPGSRCVVVKATSSAGRVLGTVLAAGPGSRAIAMNLHAEPYLATLLAGENSPLDLRGHAPERMRRLQERLAAPVTPLHRLTVGELAALSWVTESLTQRELLERHPGRVLAVDFDDFLAAVAPAMARILAHLGLPADPTYLAGVERSPVLMGYSKAPEHAYTPALRAEVLADSRQRNATEIRRGLAWLETLARSDARVATVVGAGV